MGWAVLTSAGARRWIARVAAASALAMSLAYVPYRLLDPAANRQIERLRTQLDKTRAETEELRRQTRELVREIDALRNDPSAVAEIARDDLGMVRPDEIIIRLEPEGAR